jgi:hyperosmotically inducible periplasmic protein
METYVLFQQLSWSMATQYPCNLISTAERNVNARREVGKPMMKLKSLDGRSRIAAAMLLGGVIVVAGCQKSHPDEKSAVNQALNGNNYSSIDVSQDRDKGVITLKGDVANQDDKTRVGDLARQAAPDYTVANEIGVRPPQASNAGSVASNVDSAIEDNFKAAIKAHGNLDDQSIHASAKNGTLVIKGSVKTPQQKKEANDLAKTVPNVQQVVNELEVKPNKHSTPTS